MAKTYARGERAWGICGRSGKKMLLKDMVFDGRYPNMRVDPAWYEGRHPQETLPYVEDPTTLYRPSPEVVEPPTPPEVTLNLISATHIKVTWTPAETDITEIEEYILSRSVDGGPMTELATCVLVRDFLGGIIDITNATFPEYPEHPGDPWANVPPDQPATYDDVTVVGGHTYCYQVEAVPMGNNQAVAQGPPITSDEMCIATPSKPTLTLFITQDYLSGLNLTQLMTIGQQVSWANGTYSGINLAAGNNPPRGYWVVSGFQGITNNAGGGGFFVNSLPNAHAVLNIDCSQLRFYGGGGGGGNESSNTPGAGGNAIEISSSGANSLDLVITMQNGANVGRIYGGGGGGGNGTNPGQESGGGGGAGGWFGGLNIDAPLYPGGVYDPANAGTNDPNVTGGQPPGGAGFGGGLGQNGTGGTSGRFGAGGFAVARDTANGTTSFVNGNTSANIRGTVQ